MLEDATVSVTLWALEEQAKHLAIPTSTWLKATAAMRHAQFLDNMTTGVSDDDRNALFTLRRDFRTRAIGVKGLCCPDGHSSK
jgi:hypothetical protein